MNIEEAYVLHKTRNINKAVDHIISSEKYKRLAVSYKHGTADVGKIFKTIIRWIRDYKKRFGAMTVRNPKGFIEALDDAVFNRVLNNILTDLPKVADNG